MKTIKLVKLLLFLAVTLLIFYLIFQKIDYVSLKEVFLNAKWPYLATGALIIVSTQIISAKKWQAVLRAMDYSLSFRDSFKIIMAASPVSAVIPAKAGDLVRAYYLKDKIPASRVAGGVVAERFIDIAILAFYSFLGALFLKNWVIGSISLSVIFSIPVFFLVVNKIKLPLGKWRERIESFLHVSNIFIREPKKLLPILFYGLILWLAPILTAKMFFLALGASVPLLYVAAAFPLAIFISLLPITIAGMGTRDSAIIYLFSQFASTPVCLGVGLLYSFFAFWFLALIGLPFMKKVL